MASYFNLSPVIYLFACLLTLDSSIGKMKTYVYQRLQMEYAAQTPEVQSFQGDHAPFGGRRIDLF